MGSSFRRESDFRRERELREIRPQRGTRQHPPEQRTDAPSNTDHKVDAVHEVLKEQLAPRIQSLTRNAIKTDRRDFYFYQRKRTGRRCSCYETETSAESRCPICIGTGVVGGFEKFGTITEVLDVTSPNLVLVNVEPNFEDRTRPTYLKLSDSFQSGYMEAELPVRANVGSVDAFKLSQPLYNRGTSIIAYDPNGSSSEIKEPEDLEPFLEFDKVRIRINFEKGDDRPLVSHFMFRYKCFEDLIISGDLARGEEAWEGTQFGAYEAYQMIPISFDGVTVNRFNNEDLLFRLEDSRFFKINMVNENRVASTLTGVDITARYVTPSLDGHITELLVI